MVPLHWAGGSPGLQRIFFKKTSPPEPLTQIQNNYTKLFLYQNCTNGYAPLTKGLPELQIRNTFKRLFLLIHWSKFKIISQGCSSWCLLPILHKLFQSAEQRGCQSFIRNVFNRLFLLNLVWCNKPKYVTEDCFYLSKHTWWNASFCDILSGLH